MFGFVFYQLPTPSNLRDGALPVVGPAGSGALPVVDKWAGVQNPPL